MATYHKEIPVRDPEKIPAAYREYYSRLARHFKAEIGREDFNSILEVGCGNGQLTVPLLKILPRKVLMFAADSFKKPYSGWLHELEERLRKARLETRVRFAEADATKLDRLRNNSVDVIVSNELLCDLTKETQMVKAFKEFHRVLRPRGVMIHGELLSSPVNKPQAMTIRADSPEGTETPGRFWNPDEISGLMMSTGFGDVEVSFFESTMSLGYEVALKELRDWGVRESFLKRNDKLLRRYGFELPFEHVIKSRRKS